MKIYGEEDLENRIIKCPHCTMRFIVMRLMIDCAWLADKNVVLYCPFCGHEIEDLFDRLQRLEAKCASYYD